MAEESDGRKDAEGSESFEELVQLVGAMRRSAESRSDREPEDSREPRGEGSGPPVPPRLLLLVTAAGLIVVIAVVNPAVGAAVGAFLSLVLLLHKLTGSGWH